MVMEGFDMDDHRFITGDALFSFKGRLPRLDYLINSIFVFIMLGMFSLLGVGIINIQPQTTGNMVVGFIVIFAAFIAYLWANMAMTVKRLHDLNYSGLCMIWINLLGLCSDNLVSVAPALGIILLFIYIGLVIALYVVPGTVGENRY
jgi:uncharacterized membrane protein YhaH (DUF805 family)